MIACTGLFIQDFPILYAKKFIYDDIIFLVSFLHLRDFLMLYLNHVNLICK